MAAISFPQSDLLDVNQIVKDLASMVSEQGDVIGGYPQHPASTPSPPGVGRGEARPVLEGLPSLPISSGVPQPLRKPGAWEAHPGGGLPVPPIEESRLASPHPPGLPPQQGLPRMRTGGPGRDGGRTAAGTPAGTAGSRLGVLC